MQVYEQQTRPGQGPARGGGVPPHPLPALPGGPVLITVGMGENWSPLACKEVYAKGVKTALGLDSESCLFDLTAAARLGQAGPLRRPGGGLRRGLPAEIHLDGRLRAGHPLLRRRRRLDGGGADGGCGAGTVPFSRPGTWSTAPPTC